jgi:hypothetical protein
MNNKLVSLIKSGDLILIAKSKKESILWVDAAIAINGDIIANYQDFVNEKSFLAKKTSQEFLINTIRPFGLFRMSFVEDTVTHELVSYIESHVYKKLTFWQKIKAFFKKPQREIDTRKEIFIKDLILKFFNTTSLQDIEKTGSFIRLM